MSKLAWLVPIIAVAVVATIVNRPRNPLHEARKAAQKRAEAAEKMARSDLLCRLDYEAAETLKEKARALEGFGHYVKSHPLRCELFEPSPGKLQARARR